MSACDSLLSRIEQDGELSGLRQDLDNYRDRAGPLPQGFWDALEAAKSTAVSSGDEVVAKALWCLGCVGRAQDLFVEAMGLLDQDQFYEAWCTLEQCELRLRSLRRHYRSAGCRFGVRHMETHVTQLQDLFPYAVFLSPGYVVQEAECSICGEPKHLLRSDCQHMVGEVYEGEQCHRVVTRADLLEVSLVTNPVQKYSVAFAGGGHNYGGVRYVRKGLSHPWAEWSYERLEVDAGRDLYPGAPRNDPCPCGSTRKFKKCCWSKRATRPHFEIYFAERPPTELPEYIENVAFWVQDELPTMSREDEDGGSPPSGSS